jgi:hypothetical protein
MDTTGKLKPTTLKSYVKQLDMELSVVEKEDPITPA